MTCPDGDHHCRTLCRTGCCLALVDLEPAPDPDLADREAARAEDARLGRGA